MLAQRIHLGLAPASGFKIGDPVTLVPVIAVGGSVRHVDVANREMQAVKAELAKVGITLDELELWQVGTAGKVVKRVIGELTANAS